MRITNNILANMSKAFAWNPFIFALVFVFILTACASKPTLEDEKDNSFLSRLFDKNTYKMYRTDIQQGNIIPIDKVEQIKLGLTKKQITYLLGTPVIPSLFHNNQWDYAYYFNPGNNRVVETYNLSLFFDRNSLIKVKKSKLVPNSLLK